MTPAEREAAGRELCRLRGIDPDSVCSADQARERWWQVAAREIDRHVQINQAILAAHEAVRRGEKVSPVRVATDAGSTLLQELELPSPVVEHTDAARGQAGQRSLALSAIQGLKDSVRKGRAERVVETARESRPSQRG